jgi:phosphomannomutase
MQPAAFKKYDIRGIVGKELITEDMYRLTQSIAAYFKEQSPNLKTVIVGMDGRTHSPLIKEHVCKALLDCGLNVTFIGICTTPLFYFANEILNVQGGVMITASHNPKIYNGLKLMLNKKTVFDHEIQAIKESFFSKINFSSKAKKGFYCEEHIMAHYIRMLSDQFSHLKNKPLKAIIDCAHGATAAIIPELVQQMNWQEVTLMYATVDGEFPAHEADPTKLKNVEELQNKLHQKDGYVGISFDGDGDRMGALTEDGSLLKGDELTSIFCKAIHDEVGPFKMVVDIKCANALLKQFREWKLNYTLTPCGVGFVRRKMKETNALFGGELSCHFCFNDRYFGFDDGIYAMMRLLEIIDHNQSGLNTLYHQLPKRFCSPEIRLECTHEKKFEIVEKIKEKIEQDAHAQIITIDGIRADYPHGGATVRASNTEPVLSIRFEGTEKENLDLIINEFYKLLQPYFDESYLKKTLRSE